MNNNLLLIMPEKYENGTVGGLALNMNFVRAKRDVRRVTDTVFQCYQDTDIFKTSCVFLLPILCF